MSAELLATIRDILGRGEDADRSLQETVEALTAERGVTWAGIAFLEDGELALGPSAGKSDERRRVRIPISYDGDRVGELQIDGEVEPGVLERIAELVSPYVLIGWDTGGEPWEP